MERIENVRRGQTFIAHLPALTLVALALTACGPSAFRPITVGVLATEDATITAEDGSFTLTSGKSFTAPFQAKTMFWDAAGFTGAMQRRRGPGNINGHSRTIFTVKDNEDIWRYALELGAKRVRVKAGATERFGVLYLAGAPKKAAGPSTANYRIEIPSRYLEASRNGRVSWVYEAWNSGTFAGVTWMLWLSDVPFP